MVHFVEIIQVPSPLLRVTAYWKSSNTEACAKKLSHLLAINIDNGGRGIGLRIYVSYCSWHQDVKFSMYALIASVIWVQSSLFNWSHL